MMRPDGRLLLVLAALSACVVHVSRVFPIQWGGPAFVLAESSDRQIIVELGDGFREPGVHQFIDVSAIDDVITLTANPRAVSSLLKQLRVRPLETGEKIVITSEPAQNWQLIRSWMPAAQRIALGIPLDPDRMAGDDWEDLPGVGPVLAQKIMLDRQINGEFGSLDQLARVRGVGPKRINAWRKFF